MGHRDIGAIEQIGTDLFDGIGKTHLVDLPGRIGPLEPTRLQRGSVQNWRQAVSDGITEKDESEHPETVAS